MEVPHGDTTGRIPVVLTPEQREQLESIAKSRSLPAGLVARARIILMSA